MTFIALVTIQTFNIFLLYELRRKANKNNEFLTYRSSVVYRN